ncbi:MAG: hypothetical protein JST54_29905 [Deltaproteobacteria bacterium]|nr:hypothetical protein [Deltaproteobacteria bacterium]
MPDDDQTDYAALGLSIQRAMVRAAEKRRPNSGPIRIRWGDKVICTGDTVSVPERGHLILEFLKGLDSPRHAVDLKMTGGCVLKNGTVIPVLRTWFDSQYEPVVEYDYTARDRVIHVWNTSEVRLTNGSVRAEYWTGNAGMWIEPISTFERIYHFSHADSQAPDFESLVVKLSIFARE